jgi:hypothetical protein
MAACPACGERLVGAAEFCDYCGEKQPGETGRQAAAYSSYRNPAPVPREEAFVSIGTGIFLTLLTCGIYSLFWQARQFRVLNAWLGRREYSFWSWFGLCLITCGFYGIYSEYQMAKSILEIQRKREWHTDPNLATLCAAVSMCGFPIASMAIQQEEINKFYNPTK